MKNVWNESKVTRHFNLQMFAEDDGDTADTTQTDDAKDDVQQDDGKGEKTYTDEEVNQLIDRKMAEWQKKQEKEQKKQQKDQDEAQKLKNMTDQEKADHELQELKDELNRLKAKDAQSEMLKTARSMLAEKNINASDELVSMLISEDADDTKEAVDSFIELFNNAVNNAVKDKLKGETPKKGESSGGMTKEQIMAVKNREQRQKLIKENMDLFK